MRLFVRYNQQGEITSAMKVTVMAAGLEHPYGYLNEGEFVLEVAPTSELEAIDSHEICDRYLVNVSNQQLQPKR